MHLHIVSFNVPWPADYGGVIDVYYRIKALWASGVKIHLHCYTYGRGKAEELERICEEVCYYERATGMKSQLSRKPYIVRSRQSEALIERLKQDDYPILLEGLHNGYVLERLKGSGRRIMVRAHNVEHEYYQELAQAEKNAWKRWFFNMESRKLRRYEPVLKEATAVLAISEKDASHFKEIGCKDVRVVPPSHGHSQVTSLLGRGEYVLYHGNLSVPENEVAALYLLKEVFNDSPYRLTIAGRNPSEVLRREIEKNTNVTLVANPDDDTMHKLLQNAHVNLLVTGQATGVKLKLMNALYEGRHCLVNSNMVAGTGLERACTVANTAEELREALDRLVRLEFDEVERNRRIDVLKTADIQKELEKIIM